MRDERHGTDLQIELVAGVTPVEFRAGEPEPSLTQGGRSPAPVANLSQCLLIVGHGVHTSYHTGKHVIPTNCHIDVINKVNF